MAEILGTVAAVSQLTSQFVILTTQLRHHIKAIRRAPEDVQAFLMDTLNFSGVLNFFLSLVEQPVPPGRGKGQQRRREKRVANIRRQCEYVCGKMKCRVDRFGELAGRNMTRIESFLKRILYLLDKQDVEALRPSIQMATVTINAMSTLFLWEEFKSEMLGRDLFLEQLRNLLPMAAKARTNLFEHQQKYGPAYEWEAPGAENPMLVVSEDIRQHIDRAIRPYSRSRPGIYDDRSSGHRRRRRRSDSPTTEANDSSVPPPPPPPPGGLGGPASDGVAYTSLQRSSTALYTSMGREASMRQRKIRRDEAVHAINPTNAPVSPLSSNERIIGRPADDMSEISDLKPGLKPSDEDKQPAIDRTSLDGHTRLSRSESLAEPYALDKSGPMKSRKTPCSRTCKHVYCDLCDESHCGKERCLFSEEATGVTAAASKDKPAVSRHQTPTPGSRVGSGGIRPSSSLSLPSSSSNYDEEEEEERVQPSPATTVESENHDNGASTRHEDGSRAVIPWKKQPDAVPGSKKTRRSPSVAGDGAGVPSSMTAMTRSTGKARAKGKRTTEEEEEEEVSINV